jgi:hypothetical protein
MRTVNTDDKGIYTFVECGKTYNVRAEEVPLYQVKKREKQISISLPRKAQCRVTGR